MHHRGGMHSARTQYVEVDLDTVWAESVAPARGSARPRYSLVCTSSGSALIRHGTANFELSAP